jgi:LPXTG-site transpeptidase (sortase) family protein
MLRIATILILWIAISAALIGVLGLWGMYPLSAFKSNSQDEIPSPEGIEEPNPITHTETKPAGATISIPSLGIASPLIFPDTADMADLNKALNQGVAHYPYSPYPGERGNIFLFGHSSNRPVEKNPARTVFTTLNKIQPGADIEIETNVRRFQYRVTSVKILKPEQTEIYLATENHKLTISTCWPVGDPTNRFVVEAEFVRSYPVRSEGIRTTSDTSS